MGKSEARTVFVCQQCGKESLKWLGRCPGCQECNSFVETTITAPSSPSISLANPPQELSQVTLEATDRFPLPLSAFNSVMGGWLVAGHLVLTIGDPDIANSTLLPQVPALPAPPGGEFV